MSSLSRKVRLEIKQESEQTTTKTLEYEIRGLREDEIPTWANFCASVFAIKANPPPASYFERHYYNDPNRGDSSSIRVMIDTNGDIVSSCRIFSKNLSLGEVDNNDEEKKLRTIEAGGIGEVCTSPLHRRRGLSKILLQDALSIMRESTSCRVSLLHAAHTFLPVYRSRGYESTVSLWSLATIDKTNLFQHAKKYDDASNCKFRLAEFPHDTSRLQFLHQQYSERRFIGCVVRSKEYWDMYLSKELNERIHVMTTCNNDSNTIQAWMSLRPRAEGRMQLIEFGYNVTSLDSKKIIMEVFGIYLSTTTINYQCRRRIETPSTNCCLE
mmetsp:Transcript_13308/g.15252  ORF Transcript_13308/g.15252 Transcript_13308/m.15252 type:complete len:326 (-) Transcript_13308:205-1182(-)